MGILVKDKVHSSVDNRLLLNPYDHLYVSFQGNINCRRINTAQTFRFTGLACIVREGDDYLNRHSKNTSLECIPITITTPNREEAWDLLYAELKKRYQVIEDLLVDD